MAKDTNILIPDNDFSWTYIAPYKAKKSTRCCNGCQRPITYKPQNRCPPKHKIAFDLYENYSRTWCNQNPEARANINQRHDEKRWNIILEHYGAFCHCPKCSERNWMFLTISHLNNDGAKQKKEANGKHLIDFIIEHNFPTDITIECWNCNEGRIRNNGVCPHLC